MAASSATETTINCSSSSEWSSPGNNNAVVLNNDIDAVNSSEGNEKDDCTINTIDTKETMENSNFLSTTITTDTASTITTTTTTTTPTSPTITTTKTPTTGKSICTITEIIDAVASLPSNLCPDNTNSNTVTSGGGTNNNLDGSSVKTPDSDCFTQPFPPSNHPFLRSASNHSSTSTSSNNSRTLDTEGTTNLKPEKVKSRWRRNSELESGHGTDQQQQHAYMNNSSSTTQGTMVNNISPESTKTSPLSSLNNTSLNLPKETDPVPHYDHIDENIYLFERKKSKLKKEMRRMVCNCILTKEERQRGVLGCLEDCLNRMLMIECGNRCLLGDHCSNKRFQKRQFAKVEPFKTVKKGWGLRTMQAIQPGQFIVEYVGEVLDPREFKSRVKRYSKENREHYYFMALKSDEIIDATLKGNLTRFINHSCDPNGETQKWTVNGELRIGFFASRLIEPGEEITFDYQFQRYGKKAQKCFCEAPNCRGYIGSTDSTSINIDGSLIAPKPVRSLEKPEEEEKQAEEEFEDLGLEEEIAKLTASGGIRNRQQTLMLARLMVRAEDTFNRTKLLEVLKNTQEIAYLRLFLDYHGLQLLWSWMVDLEDIYLKGEILEVLAILPIPNKTVLKDSKVLDVVERWAKQAESEASQRKDGALSVNAQLPLIVEPSTTVSSLSLLTVPVKKEDKKEEESLSVKEKESQQQPHQPSSSSSTQQQSKQQIGEEESEKSEVTNVQEELKGKKKGEEGGEDEPEQEEEVDKVRAIIESVVKNEESLFKEEVIGELKEEKAIQNKIPDGKISDTTASMEVSKDSAEEVVSVSVEIELGCEVEIKQDVNGDTEMVFSEHNQSASSTPGDSTPGKPEPIKARETRSSSTSSTTSSVDVSSTSTPTALPPPPPQVIAEKVIGRRVSKSRVETKDDTVNKVTKELVKPVPDIAMLTSKLLYLWKDLKEVFRIPRLERQKRLEDEKEADRKAVEEQERKARGLPVFYDPKVKRGIDNRDNTIAGILKLRELRKKTAKRPSDDKKPVQNNLNSSSPASNTNSGIGGPGGGGNVNPENNTGPTPPKVNKEVHRMQFEMEFMRKEYSAALEKYNEQIRQYQEKMQMIQSQNQQLPGPHSTLPLNSNINHLPLPQPPSFDSNYLPSHGSLLHQSPFKAGQVFNNSPNLIIPTHPPPPVPPPGALGIFPGGGYGVNSDYSSNSGLTTPATPIAPMTPLTPSTDYHQQSYNLESHHPNYINTLTTTSQQQFSVSYPLLSKYTSEDHTLLRSQENRLNFGSPSNSNTSDCHQSSSTTNYLSFSSIPVLIDCTVSLNHTLMSDEKAVISTDYGVEYVPVKKSSSSKSLSTTPSPSKSSGTIKTTPTTTQTTTTTTSKDKPSISNNENNSNNVNCRISISGNSSNNHYNNSHETLFNSVYPAPGTYYLTPDDDNNCFFVPPPFDLHGHQVEPFVFEKVPTPFSPIFTKELIQTALPPNWRCSKDSYGNVYYYNKVTKMVQWDLPAINLVTQKPTIKSEPMPLKDTDPVANTVMDISSSSVNTTITNTNNNNNNTDNTSQDESRVQSQQSLSSSSSMGQQTPGDVHHQQQHNQSTLPEKMETCTEEQLDSNNNTDDPTLTTNENTSNSNDDNTPSVPTTAQPSKETSPQTSSEEPLLVNGGESGSTPYNLTANEDSTSECLGTPSHSLPGSYEPDPRKRRTSSTNSSGLHNLTNNNSTSTNNDSESKKSLKIVKSFSSLMEFKDGELIASNRRDRGDKSERRIKEKFKAEMSEHIKYCLNPYRKIDCRVGRILCNDDFKYVARRLTHFVMLKELQYCRRIGRLDDLCCSETVKHKAKQYVKRYMAAKGPIYRPEANEEIFKDNEKCSPNS